MGKRTNVDGLADALSEILNEYVEQVNNNMYRAGKKAIKTLVDKTTDTAPVGNRGAFSSSITSKSTKPDLLGRSSHIWYVKAPNHRLTHLLVHGHATRDGGRARSNPFLRNALKEVEKQYIEDIEEAVK